MEMGLCPFPPRLHGLWRDKEGQEGQGGTGQIREKVRENDNGIGIADAGSLSSEAGEEVGGSKQIRTILNLEGFRQDKAR